MDTQVSRLFFVAWLALGSAVSLQAATPPGRINYQGVLRDAANVPENGDRDMVLRFYDASGGAPPCPASGGTLILTDSHLATGTGAVTVTGGLFDVELGGGSVADGPGPGTYTSLGAVFRDHADVYLEVAVGGETLCPRIRIVSAAFALNADHLDGKTASEFIDTSGTSQTKTGPLTVDSPISNGVEGYGPNAGGYFKDRNDSGFAYVGFGDWGVYARGNSSGGYFKDIDGSGYAYVGNGDNGISAVGSNSGGEFHASGGTGFAWVAMGDRGLWTWGSLMGGQFEDSDSSAYAYVAYGDQGIHAQGNSGGGYFKDRDNSGYAYVGWGHYGINAYGNTAGGYFADLDSSGNAYVGNGDYGVWARGNSAGGYFKDANSSGYAYVGNGDYGITAAGSIAGGYFGSTSIGGWTEVATGTYKVYGPGGVSFVQNHPYVDDQVIVYTAPEGDEVATYTRGTARLSDGEARVPLGETFQWVTNPDIGLTAHVTPRGGWADLYVASITTTELVVRSRGGSAPDAAFDYIVHGLRIGFEEASVVQEKTREAYIPSMKDHRDLYSRRPDLRSYNALERYRAMANHSNGETEVAPSSRRAGALRDAIQEYDPAVHGGVEDAGHPPIVVDEAKGGRPRDDTSANAQTAAIDDEGNVYARSFRPSAADLAALVSVAEPVVAGDVLVIDTEQPGRMKLSRVAADARVVGIVAAEPGVVLGVLRPSASNVDESPVATNDVPVAVSGVALCKVDAGYGSIRPGDLLTSSPTPGHAMRADDPRPGTILGKALVALETGTGLIRVLVTLR